MALGLLFLLCTFENFTKCIENRSIQILFVEKVYENCGKLRMNGIVGAQMLPECYQMLSNVVPFQRTRFKKNEIYVLCSVPILIFEFS